MSEYIEVGQPLQFTDPNTPTRVGEIVENVSDIYNIPSPRLGMQVFVKSEKKSFVITSLKNKVINGVDVPEAAVEAFEPVGAKSITWNNDTDPSNMNDFVVAGVYDIKGEHTRIDDNLPILNTGGGHSFNARLTVLDSSISGSGEDDDKCITQVLSFSNRLGQGEVYIRTGKGRTLDSLSWEQWSTLQRNVNVVQIRSLDNLIDNGIYSGVLTPTGETFVLVVINNYAFASQHGTQKCISQFKYSVDPFGAISFGKRVKLGNADFPAEWDILNRNEINKMLEDAVAQVIANVVNGAPEAFDTLKEIADWIEKHGDVTAIYNAIQQNIAKINASIKSLDVSPNTDDVELGLEDNTDKTTHVVFPAATTESAGVMTAEDKAKLDKITGIKEVAFDFSDGGSIAQYANRSIKYKFVEGATYEIEVLTDEGVATYFSLRNEPTTALQSDMCSGTGRRSGVFTAKTDAEYLYMSLATEGTPTKYDVLIKCLSETNINTLRVELDEMGNLAKVYSEVPDINDFVIDKQLTSGGEIGNRSGYCATEKYYTMYKGTVLRAYIDGFASLVGIAVYDETFNFEEAYPGNYSGDIVFNDTKKVRFAVSYANLHKFYVQIKNYNIGDVSKNSSFVSKYILDDFEIGNISISATGWVYHDDTRRVRTKSGITYHMHAGDMVVMQDNIRVYVGKREGNTYSLFSWSEHVFHVQQDGEYVFLFAFTSNEHALYGVDEILSKVRILSNGGYYQKEVLPYNPIADDLPTIRVVNHRGFNTEAPENTESAYKLSKLRGFRYVETDVSFTSDNIPVILHDATIDRTSNGTGKISEMTYAEASLYDYGSWFSEKYTGEPLLTFDRFMLLCKTLGLLPYVELKTLPTEQEHNILNIAAKYGMLEHTTWISFDSSILQRIQQVRPSARLGYVGDLSEEFITTALTLKNDVNEVFVDIQGSSATETLIMSARNKELGVEMWNHGGISNPLLPLLDGITTDSVLLWNYRGDIPVWGGYF